MKTYETVCDELPEDWEIRIIMRRGEMDVELIDPDGNIVDVDDELLENTGEFRDRLCGPPTDDYIHDMVILRTNIARNSDGLQLLD